MSACLRSFWRLLAGVAAAALFFADHGAFAEREAKPSDRASDRKEAAESRPQEKSGGRSQTANARRRGGRPARGTQPEELFGISWFGSLDGARRAAARGGPIDAGKPIFCFRVLGDLAGFM